MKVLLEASNPTQVRRLITDAGVFMGSYYVWDSAMETISYLSDAQIETVMESFSFDKCTIESFTECFCGYNRPSIAEILGYPDFDAIIIRAKLIRKEKGWDK